MDVNLEEAVQACIPSICKAIGCSAETADWLARYSPLLVDESGRVVFPEHICHPQGIRYQVQDGSWLRLAWSNVEDGYMICDQFDYHRNLLSLIERTGISNWNFREESGKIKVLW